MGYFYQFLGEKTLFMAINYLTHEERHFDDDVLKVKILECQWDKKYNNLNKQKKNCNMCSARFACLTLRARKFQISRIEYYTSVVFAESKTEASNLYFDYEGREDIVRGVELERRATVVEITEVSREGYL
jgi:hypothetical protein